MKKTSVVGLGIAAMFVGCCGLSALFGQSQRAAREAAGEQQGATEEASTAPAQTDPQGQEENVPSAQPRVRDEMEQPVSVERWWAERLATIEPPPELEGMTLDQIEATHRAMDVYRWNTLGSHGGRGNHRRDVMAEELNLHVSTLEAVDTFIHFTRTAAVAEGLREFLAGQEDIELDHYHPVEETAFLGTYTVRATITLDGCRNDDDLDAKLDDAVTRLAESLPPRSGGFKVGRVRYSCEATGTSGSLGHGVMWVSAERRAVVMEECGGSRAPDYPVKTRFWCQPSWNDMKPLTE